MKEISDAKKALWFASELTKSEKVVLVSFHGSVKSYLLMAM